MRSSTIGKLFEWLTLHERVDPVHALRLEDEWRRLTFGMAGEIATTVPSEEWPRLWDAYDERAAIMTEGREVRDEDLAAAWKSALKGYRKNEEEHEIG